MRGVTIARYAAYKGRPVTKDELRHISPVELEDIYRRGYWNKVAADDLPPGLDLTMFDYAVNSGPARAVKTLQKIVGVTPDGVMGSFTVQAVRKYDTVSLIRRMYEARMGFLRNLSTWSTFGKGWASRVNDILDRSLAMAKGKAVTPPMVVEPTPRANPADTKTLAKPNAKAKAASAAGSVGAAVTEASQQLAPHASSLEVIKWLCIALAVVSAGILIWRAIKEQPA
jgi:lysozyme family protein